eukprot:119655-Pelagomonas_calceolata.AAC.1
MQQAHRYTRFQCAGLGSLYSTICRVSKKLFPPFESDSATMCVDQAPSVHVFGSLHVNGSVPPVVLGA